MNQSPQHLIKLLENMVLFLNVQKVLIKFFIIQPKT